MTRDQKTLFRFVEDIDLLLGFVTLNKEVFFPSHLRRFVSPAWEVVQNRVRELRNLIEGSSSYRNLLPDLEAHGLTGAELNLKMANFEEGISDFRPVLYAGEITFDLSSEEKSGLRAWIHRKLKKGNVVLESLPGVVAGGINEFKKIAEQAIEDVEHPERTRLPSVVPKGG